jgi:hypothetical protein
MEKQTVPALAQGKIEQRSFRRFHSVEVAQAIVTQEEERGHTQGYGYLWQKCLWAIQVTFDLTIKQSLTLVHTVYLPSQYKWAS